MLGSRPDSRERGPKGTRRVEAGVCQSCDSLQLGAKPRPCSSRKTLPHRTPFLHLEDMPAEVQTARTGGPEPAAGGEQGGSGSNGERGTEGEGRERPLRARPATHPLPGGQPLPLAVRREPQKLGCRRLTAEGRLGGAGGGARGGASGSRDQTASRDTDAARPASSRVELPLWPRRLFGCGPAASVEAGRLGAQPSGGSRWSLVAAELTAFGPAGNRGRRGADSGCPPGWRGVPRGGSASHP